MTMCRLSGPDFHSCSACCFSALQTDAPSNLFILGCAMGVTHCRFMASIQRRPTYKLSFTMMAFMDVCNVCVPAWTYARDMPLFFSLALSFCLSATLYLEVCCKFNVYVYPHLVFIPLWQLCKTLTSYEVSCVTLAVKICSHWVIFMPLYIRWSLGVFYQGGLCWSIPVCS